MRKLLYLLPCLLAAPVQAADGIWGDNARLTVGLPVYVKHADPRQNIKPWNEGWFHNEGVLADLIWPVWNLGTNTEIRAGFALGAFDNSIYRLSVFTALAGEIDTHITPRWLFNAGTYAGAITGYDHAVSPALTPYAGTAYNVADGWQLGVRGFWLPARTLQSSSVNSSDAYVGTVTLGYQF